MNTQKLIEAVEGLKTPDDKMLGGMGDIIPLTANHAIDQVLALIREHEAGERRRLIEFGTESELFAALHKGLREMEAHLQAKHSQGVDEGRTLRIIHWLEDEAEEHPNSSHANNCNEAISILRPYLRTQCEAAKPTAQVSEAITKIVEIPDEEGDTQYKLVFIVGVQSFNIGYTSDDRREVEQLERMFLKAIAALKEEV